MEITFIIGFKPRKKKDFGGRKEVPPLGGPRTYVVLRLNDLLDEDVQAIRSCADIIDCDGEPYAEIGVVILRKSLGEAAQLMMRTQAAAEVHLRPILGTGSPELFKIAFKEMGRKVVRPKPIALYYDEMWNAEEQP